MQIRHLIAIIIVLAAVLPSLAISLVMLNQQHRATEKSLAHELGRVLETMSGDVGFKFATFSTNYKLFSSERLLTQALDSFLFSSHAYRAMERFVEQSPLVNSIFLLDIDLQVVEEFNGSIVGLENSNVHAQLQSAIAQKKIKDGRQYLVLFEDYTLVKGTRESQNPIPNSPFGVAVISPLYLHVLQEGLSRSPEGYLVAILPFQEIYSILEPELRDDETISLRQGSNLLASTAKVGVNMDAQDLLLTSREGQINSEHTENAIPLTLQMQVSRSGRMQELDASLNTLYKGIAIAIALSLLAALLIVRWLSKPIAMMSDTIKRYSQGNYQPIEIDLKYQELKAVSRLLVDMGQTIQQQFDTLRNKNIELQKVSELKDEYLAKVKALNEQLEQRVEEKTKELRLTLEREEDNRQLLQNLLRLSIDLQACDSVEEVVELCLKQIPHLYSGSPLAVYLSQTRYQSSSLHTHTFDEDEKDWLYHELCAIEQPSSQALPDTLEFGVENYSLIRLASMHTKLLGVLVLKSKRIRGEQRDFLTLFAKQASAIIETVRLTQELAAMARTDGLTELANRKAFDEAYERERITHERYPDRKSAIFIIDANNLKFINDQYGHACGDRLIVTVAGILKRECRKSDQIFRLGGDEFAIIVRNGGIEICQALTDRLLNAQKNSQIQAVRENGSTQILEVSFSIGFASTEEASIGQLLHQADKRMYEHKNAYRNPTETAKP